MHVRQHTLHVRIPTCAESKPELNRRSRVMSVQKPAAEVDRSWTLPPLGDNPSTDRQGTTPGSFALLGRVGTPWMYSSPDTPGMPGVSELTAMDFRDADRDRAHK